MIVNKSYRNACILHDVLSLNAKEGETFADNNPGKLTTDNVGNITHILGKKVIIPRIPVDIDRGNRPGQLQNASWYELEGVSINDRRETMKEVGLV